MICICLVSFSCKKKKTESPPDLGYNYYPTTIGKYIIYDIDSTVYDDFKHDTTYYKYRIKEKFEENFTDNQGRPTIRLVRYIKFYDPNKSYDDMPWVVKDVWAANFTTSSVQVVEENVRFTKLSFPVKEGAEWNGNALNTNDEWDYQYDYINNPETINGHAFDKVLYVEQKDDKQKNYIHRELYFEKYASGVGLVYREIMDLYSQNVQAGVPVEQRIEKGLLYTQTYVTHGYE